MLLYLIVYWIKQKKLSQMSDLSSLVGNSVYVSVWESIRGSVYDFVWASVDDSAREAVWNFLNDSMGDTVRNAVVISVMTKTEEIIYDE